MADQEGSRWDVSLKSNAVCLERISDEEDQVFEDSLSAEEARKLGQLLTKFADKLDESGDKDDKDDSDNDDSDKDDSDKDDSDEDDSDKSKD